ncbi:hypothetical protein ZWY2020_052577 [Hordeum vulgare]|nr:hypothetical protein ZWY2020_052577 [Hordeum vulgare]
MCRRSSADNITRFLTGARGFNVAVSMLEASGGMDDFESDEWDAGITFFCLLVRGVCTLDSFDEMPNDNSHSVSVVHLD